MTAPHAGTPGHAALALATLLALAACARAPSAGQASAMATPVAVAPVVAGPDLPALRLHGVIASRDESRLSFKVGGLISRISVDAGDSVRAGQLLAEIEPTEPDAQLAQARELDAKAARDLQRAENLYRDEVISLEQLQNQRTQRELAAAQWRTAQFERGHARIVAPADGVVLARMAEIHELVAPGQGILMVSAGGRGYVLRAAVADRELLQLRTDLPATVRLDAAPGTDLQGHVSLISRAADPATGLFPVEISLGATTLRLASGMVATAWLQPGVGTPLAHMPAGALVTAEGTHATVFVLQGEHARRRDIEIAFIDGTDIAARSGLQIGEQVITDGAPYLDDGERVAIAAH
jgi:membrane fusion protein, multidrug efflux system